MSAGALVAVLPVKNLDAVKQRLAPRLSQRERTGLFLAAVEDVMEAIAGARSLAGAVVVTRDDRIAALAGDYGLDVVVEPANRGHTEAVSFGAAHMAQVGASGLLQLPGDIPLLTPEDIDAVAAAHRAAPAVTIVPSRDYRGSNAVAVSPPDCFPFRFGSDSFYPHLDAARALGIEPTVVERDNIALDLDTPGDLDVFLATPSDTRAYRHLCAIASCAARTG